MGLLGDIFSIVDDVVSIPTDSVGLTNYYKRQRAFKKAKEHLIEGKINEVEYQKVLIWIDKNI